MKRILFLIPLWALLLLCSCKEDCADCEFPSVKPSPPPTEATRVLFHYMAMNNSLSSDGASNISAMVEAATTENLNGGAIIVFKDLSSTAPPSLVCIYDGLFGGKGYEYELKVYDAETDSSDPATLEQALADAREFIASDSWVLTVGSHGNGWMPSNLIGTYGRIASRRDGGAGPLTRHHTRALIEDGGNYMESAEFIGAVPDGFFDFIIGDLCLMGGIEFAYGLRNKADYLILSPAEVLAQGMPYGKIIPHIFADSPRLGEDGICQEFIDYYATHQNENYRFATIALYDCSNLSDFAVAMRNIVQPNLAVIAAMTEDETDALNLYDRNTIHSFFDIASFVDKLYPSGGALKDAFDQALDKLIIYKETTGEPLAGFVVEPEWYTGVSTYIPTGGAQYTRLTEAYRETDWYKAVYE